jgi:hypothetical protein
MNSKQQPSAKININNIFFEDSFIDLINKLSKSIQEYYHPSLALITKSSKSLNLFENYLNQLISAIDNNNDIYTNNINTELYTNINNLISIKNELKVYTIKADENLKIFMEKSKIIFKEMKTKKNDKLEDIYNDYARKNNINSINQRISNYNITNNDNEHINNLSQGGNAKAYRLSQMSQNHSNLNSQKRERNKTMNKTNTNYNFTHINIPFIKNLIVKMNEYDEIISKYSNEAKDNYTKLKKQLLFEINKSINSNSSKSVERKGFNKSYTIQTNKNNTNTNVNNNNNPFIMVNNNNNNVTMTTTNNNSYYNFIDNQNLQNLNNNSFNTKGLDNYINNNNNNIDQMKEINNLKEQLKEANIIIESMKLEKKNYNKFRNELEIKIKSLANQNNELKKENSLLLKKDSKDDRNKNCNEDITEEKSMVDAEVKKLKEELENKKKEYELNFKKLNDENTSLSKCLADKNREIQVLQNNNKLKMNELNKIKLIVKTNEKQLKVKKLKADQQKANSPNTIKIKDLLSNSRNDHDNNEALSPNISYNTDNPINKEMISKLESQISQLKEEKESLTSNLSVLEKDINEKISEKEILENELNNKNNIIKDENILIGELKAEKEKLIHKLKEYKNIEELNLSQIKILKEHIKQMEKQQNVDSEINVNKKKTSKKELQKKINDLEIENKNISMQLEMEINYNGKLKNEVKTKAEQIEGLNIVIKKLIAEKESDSTNRNSSNKKSNENSNLNNINRSKTDEFIMSSKDKNINLEINYTDNKNDKEIMVKKGYNTDKKLDKILFSESNSKNEGAKSEDIKLDNKNNN